MNYGFGLFFFFHMTPNRSYFYEFFESCAKIVYMGNHQTCQTKGIGLILLALSSGNKIRLTKVRYILDLKRNLIFFGMFVDSGCCSSIRNSCMSIHRNNNILLIAKKISSLYILGGIAITNSMNTTVSIAMSSTIEKWRLRLAHLNTRYLKHLEKHGMLGKDIITDMNICELCVLGKQHKNPFGVRIHTLRDILEYIHADLLGPKRCSTKGSCKYFLCLVDDFSRKVWIFWLKNKSNVFVKFKDWVTFQEN